MDLFSRFLVEGDDALISNLAAAAGRSLKDFAGKPKRVILLREGETLTGAVIFVPKRGGCVKINVLGAVSASSLDASLAMVVPSMIETGFRKLCLFLPSALPQLRGDLIARPGRIEEGRLREPYRNGEDISILSRFLN
jgi:hypothetical protein